MPEPWIALVLALVAFRVTRLVGWDDITANARAWVSVPDQTYTEWIEIQDLVESRGEGSLWAAEEKGYDFPQGIPFDPLRWYIARLIRCPWCAGWWVSLLVALGAALAGLVTWGWALPFGFALSAVVGLLAKWLDP